MKKKIKSKSSKKAVKALNKKKIAIKKTTVKKSVKKGFMKKIMGHFKKVVQKPVKTKKASKKVKKVKFVKKLKPVKTVKKMKSVPKKLKTRKTGLKSAPKKMKAKKLLPKKVQKMKVSKKAPRRVLNSKQPKPKTAGKPVQPKVAESQPVAVQAEAQIFTHEPVMVNEVLENMQLADKKLVVDCTLGLGGHSLRMLEQMPADGRIIAFDVDEDNLATAKKRLAAFGERFTAVLSNFANLQEELNKLGVKGVDGILLDLGLSSPQVDNPEKGFSFMREGPLDMRFDKTQQLTAADVVNGYTINDLVRIFQVYGEERFARKIAQEISRRRKARSFKTTTELANFIEKLIGRQGHIHPATRIFQALRIEVNHELDVLLSVLKQSVAVLKKNGRLEVIAYHSLEDRVVKQFFKECARDFINEPDKLTTTHLEPTLHIVTKKPLVPTDPEIAKNPRSRSAKLRIAEKI